MPNYYDSGNITIFPSSNAIDNGKVTSEQNIRNIISRLRVKNYKMKSTDFKLSISGTTISVADGIALIDGYRIETTGNISLTDTFQSSSSYYVVMKINIEDNKIKGNSPEGTKCEGVEINVVSQSEYNTINNKNSYLVLGTLLYNSGTWIVTTYDDNIYPFSSDQIMVDSTNPPPTGSITDKLKTLETGFVSSINNDSKIGYLEFKSSGSSSKSLGIYPSDGSIKIYNNDNIYLSETYNSVSFRNGSNSSSVSGNGSSVSLKIGNSEYITVDETSGIKLNGNSKNISLSTNSSNIKLENGKSSIELVNSDSSIVGKIESVTLLSIKSGESIIGNISITDDTNNVVINTNNNKPISFGSQISCENALSAESVSVGNNKLSTSDLKIGNTTIGSSTISTTGSIISGSSSNNTKIDNSTITIKSSNTDTISFDVGTSSSIGSIVCNKDGNSGVISIKAANASDDDKSKINLDAKNVEVTGNLRAHKVYNAVYNGFGEIFRKPTDEIIDYGDVVCIGQDGLVHKMSENYSLNRIIGICSNTIGIELGGSDIPDEEKVEVELIGKIWVKTDAEYILPGSLITFTIDGKAKIKSESDTQNAIALSNVVDGKVLVYYSSNTVR